MTAEYPVLINEYIPRLPIDEFSGYLTYDLAHVVVKDVR